MKMNHKEKCSFCAQPKGKVLSLIASTITEAYICNECVALCEEIILDNLRSKYLKKEDDIFILDDELIAMIPKEIALCYNIVPLYYRNNYLYVAGISSEKHLEIIKILKKLLNLEFIGFIDYPYKTTVLNSLNKYYDKNIE